MKEGYLNIAAICDKLDNGLGPGNRFKIWVQGCSSNCKNCIAPEWREKKEANLIKTEKLASLIVNEFPNIDGITISGGEPMLQAKELSKLIKIIKDKLLNIDFIVYTGYVIDDLTNRFQKEILENIDLLIDGQYTEEKNDNVGLRGSSNQKYYFLSNKLTKYQKQILNAERT